MKFYRLRPKGIRKEFIYILICQVSFIIAIFIVVSIVLREQLIEIMSTNRGVIILFVTFGLFALGVLNLSLNRFKVMWHSFRIIMDGEVLTRQMEGAFEIYINLQDIDEIIEDASRGIEIKDILKRKIFIPNSLEGYEDIKSVLITHAKNKRITRKKILFNEWFFQIMNK